jgi:hypothetical protein
MTDEAARRWAILGQMNRYYDVHVGGRLMIFAA